ncbi:MAG: 3-phosphoserine/phosphohydroxythreonine transaminase [Clostridia bacterium]|nr:3-phosphoserine/phosphohydroxythreonine transaminase [Clostridia bacterium]
MNRVYNFSAGPSMLPLEVLKRVQSKMLDYEGSGMSVMEMSHRSKYYDAINNEAESLLRELMNVPENYDIIFVQGGASMQFEAIPLNLHKNGKADYILSGNFSSKAYKEAQKFTDAVAAASSKDKDFTYVPETTPDMFRADADYVHMCYNNTIYGTRFTKIPETPAGVPLVGDVSSNILSEVMDVSKFGVLYGGAQKNVAPAGVTVVIVRKDLQDMCAPICPTMLKWKTQVDQKSLYNTPPCWSTYVAMEVFRYIKELGGVPAMQKINEEKAKILYDFLDNSKFFVNKVNPADRSLMNVPFFSPSAELDAKFIAEAAKEGLVTLKGHKLVGGMRASIYNAMPVEGVKKLVEFMAKFEKENK